MPAISWGTETRRPWGIPQVVSPASVEAWIFSPVLMLPAPRYNVEVWAVRLSLALPQSLSGRDSQARKIIPEEYIHLFKSVIMNWKGTLLNQTACLSVEQSHQPDLPQAGRSAFLVHMLL